MKTPHIYDSRQLLAFVTLGRVGSFTRTAKDLSLTQSAISHAIKTLEEEVGCQLVERSRKKVALTQAGEVFLQYAERTLSTMGAAQEAMDSMSNWGQGRLRIGASSTSCQYILPTVLREYKQCFPRCAITIEAGDQPQLMEALVSGQVDLAITPEPQRYRELEFIPLFDDELRYFMLPVHPWATAGKVRRESITEETLLLYTRGSHTNRIIQDYFREERIQTGQVIELSAMEAIKELVRAGVGVGIMAPWVAREELSQGTLVSLPMGRHPLRRHWGLSHLKGRKPSLGEEVFMGLCKTVTEKFSEL